MTERRITTDPFSTPKIGLESYLSSLDKFSKLPNYPPHGILKEGEYTEIQVALAGFSKSEIKVSQVREVLSISAAKSEKSSNYASGNLSMRDANLKFVIGEHCEVDSVSFVDGLLKIRINEKEDERNKTFEIE